MANHFTEKLIEREGGKIRFIKTTEKGRACWCYLQVDPLKFSAYKRALQQEVMNIRDYGEILQGDWGEFPPPEVIAYMQEIYHFETPHAQNH